MSGDETWVRVPPDSSGKKIRMSQSTINNETVQTEVVKISDSNDIIRNPAREDGNLATILSQLQLIKAKTDNIDVALSTRTKPADTQYVIFPPTSMEDTVFLKTADYHSMVAKGEVTGHTVNHCIGNGSGSTIPTSSYAILTNATVTQPAANTAMKIVSTSANDTLLGTGAQEITIEYFPSAWGKTLSTEIIEMNGVTPVSLTNVDVYRIDKLYISKLGGSGSGADGTITLVDNATGLVKYAQIDPGAAFFERAIHYIPTTRICVITGASFSSSTSGGVIVRLFTTEEDNASHLVPRAQFSLELTSGVTFMPLSLPIKVDNPNGLRKSIGIAVKGLTSNQSCVGTLRYYEEDD